MSKIKLLATAALLTSLGTSMFAAPAAAEWRHGRSWDRGGGPGAVAAGVAGAVIGGALASGSYRDSYAYYGDDPGPGYGYGYGYAPGYRYGNSGWNSSAGAGGYNTGATNYNYNSW